MHTKLVGKVPFRERAGLWDRVASFCNGLDFIITLVLVMIKKIKVKKKDPLICPITHIELAETANLGPLESPGPRSPLRQTPKYSGMEG